MESTSGMRALKDLFGFPFRDPAWGRKFLIGSLIFVSGFFIPILPWIALWGYAARVMRNSIEGEGSLHLPEWDNWGELFSEGLKLSLVGLFLTLPAVLIYLLGMGMYFGSFFSAVMIQAIAGDEAAAPFFFLMIFAMFFMFLAMSVATLLTIVSWFLIPPVGAHVVATRRLGALFDLRQWWRIVWANPGGFLLVFFVLFSLWAVSYLVFYLLYMTIVLCIFTPLVVAPLAMYTIVVGAVMTGQSYREARQKLDLAVSGPVAADSAVDGSAA